MTFEEFKKRVDENRFIVKQVSATKFEIYSIEYTSDGKFYLSQYRNTETKDGRFTASGYGYSKPIYVMEIFARQLGKAHHDYYLQRQNQITI